MKYHFKNVTRRAPFTTPNSLTYLPSLPMISSVNNLNELMRPQRFYWSTSEPKPNEMSLSYLIRYLSPSFIISWRDIIPIPNHHPRFHLLRLLHIAQLAIDLELKHAVFVISILSPVYRIWMELFLTPTLAVVVLTVIWTKVCLLYQPRIKLHPSFIQRQKKQPIKCMFLDHLGTTFIATTRQNSSIVGTWVGCPFKLVS